MAIRLTILIFLAVAFLRHEDNPLVWRMYESTVWVGHYNSNGTPIRNGSGWVVATKGKTSYIVTAEHVIHDRKNLLVAYWTGTVWDHELANIEGVLVGERNGDIAILSIQKILKPLPLASDATAFAKDDEILVGGVQHDAPPAMVTLGTIVYIWSDKSKFTVDGWAWYGHSGGPVVSRKTGEVIGIIAWASSGHKHDASKSDCSSYKKIRQVLERLNITT